MRSDISARSGLSMYCVGTDCKSALSHVETYPRDVGFPLIVSIGAGGEIQNPFSLKICKLLGDISYPIYITHYPLIYWYTAWVVDNKVSLEDGYALGIGVLIASILIAYVCLKLYDEPVRNWLQNKLKKRKTVVVA